MSTNLPDLILTTVTAQLDGSATLNTIESAIAVFVNWQFFAASVAIFSVVRTVKQVFERGAPELLKKNWFYGFFLTPLNLVLGIGIALLPNFLYGKDFAQRSVVGVAAGFLSHFIYDIVRGGLANLSEQIKEALGNKIAKIAEKAKTAKADKASTSDTKK